MNPKGDSALGNAGARRKLEHGVEQIVAGGCNGWLGQGQGHGRVGGGGGGGGGCCATKTKEDSQLLVPISIIHSTDLIMCCFELRSGGRHGMVVYILLRRAYRGLSTLG